MSYREDKQREIESINERTFNLKLSDSDVQRIWEKAGSVGLTVSKLLESFIGDLVNGTYSNGSDERMYAQQWFDRCHFGMFPDKTFLRYLIAWDSDVESIVELWNDINSAKRELEKADSNKGAYSEEEIEDIRADIAYWNEQLNDTFSEFKDWAKDESIGTLEEEMEKVLKWYADMKQMKEGTDERGKVNE